MIVHPVRKRYRKSALVTLFPFFLVVFAVGWIISWIGQLKRYTPAKKT